MFGTWGCTHLKKVAMAAVCDLQSLAVFARGWVEERLARVGRGNGCGVCGTRRWGLGRHATGNLLVLRFPHMLLMCVLCAGLGWR
jgi:hypothetical protein